jgi:hypothetical protein
MSQQAENDPEPAGEHDSTPCSSRCKSVWTNNKGIFLIILAQAVGSTMDAIVRFLQQGGHGMHPFQVKFPMIFHAFPSGKLFNSVSGHFRPHEHYLSAECDLYVVDQGS